MDIFWIENLLIDHCEAESSKCSAEKPTWQSSLWIVVMLTPGAEQAGVAL